MPRRCRQVAFESPLQMRLIGKACFQGYFRDDSTTAQPCPGILHTLIEQIAMRRQAKLLLERPNQVRTGQADGITNVL